MTKTVEIEGICSNCEFVSELSEQGLVPAIRNIEAHLAEQPCNFVKSGKCEAASLAIGQLMEISAKEAGV